MFDTCLDRCCETSAFLTTFKVLDQMRPLKGSLIQRRLTRILSSCCLGSLCNGVIMFFIKRATPGAATKRPCRPKIDKIYWKKIKRHKCPGSSSAFTCDALFLFLRSHAAWRSFRVPPDRSHAAWRSFCGFVCAPRVLQLGPRDGA